MRCQGGAFSLWTYHRDRLQRCSGINEATIKRIEAGLAQIGVAVSAWRNGARVRLRYGSVEEIPHWDLSAFPLERETPWSGGVTLYPCATHLVSGSASESGCKRLDRAAYEKASAELHGRAADWEGLLLDTSGALVETLRCNLLMYRDGQWWTPDLARCGVRGVMRSWLQDRIQLGETELRLCDLHTAEELALCNSVRGVIPVTSVFDSDWIPRKDFGSESPVTQLQRLVAQELW